MNMNFKYNSQRNFGCIARIYASGLRAHGEGLVEVMFSLVLFALIGLGFAYSGITASNTSGRNFQSAAAMKLALEKMEEFVRINPQDLSDADDATESSVQSGNMSFTRTTDVTINTDRTRSVEITVISNVPNSDTAVTIANSFALWGTR